jgi:hypothetical protein
MMQSNSQKEAEELVGQTLQIQHKSGVRNATVREYDVKSGLHSLIYEDTGREEVQDMSIRTYRAQGAATWHKGKKRKGGRNNSSGGGYSSNSTTTTYTDWQKQFIPYTST